MNEKHSYITGVSVLTPEGFYHGPFFGVLQAGIHLENVEEPTLLDVRAILDAENLDSTDFMIVNVQPNQNSSDIKLLLFVPRVMTFQGRN